MKTLISAFLILFLVAFPQKSFAQKYPSRPILMIVPFAPGGVPDIFARLIAERAAQILKQPVIVDNRSGAGGNIGLKSAISSPPDGYTLVVCVFSCATNPFLYKPQPFDLLRDLTPIMLIGTLPNVLVVNAKKVPATNLAELVKMLKDKPDSIAFASSGAGSSGHLANELFKRSAGVATVHVPYRGQGQAVNDLIAGSVLGFFDGIPSSLPHIRSGALRAIATTGSKRANALPDVPTMEEAGLAGFQVIPWMALMGPANLPAQIAGNLNQAFNQALLDATVQRRFLELSVESGGGTSAELEVFLKTELARWQDTIEKNNIRID